VTTAPDPRFVIETVGISGVVDVQPVGGGMSGAILWRVRREEAGTDLLLRLFPHSDMPTVQHEAAVQRRALDGGVTTPRIEFVGTVAGCPTIVMEWLAGRTMLNVMADDPDQAEGLGLASGQLLRQIHELPDIADLAGGGNFRYRLAGVEPWLIERISTGAREPTTTHLDYHPSNLLVDDHGNLSVLDWTNASVGDPLIDLGRTFAFLQFGAALYAESIARDAMDAWWRGLVAGYGAEDRTIDELAPFFAFGLVTLVNDRLGTQDDGVLDDGVLDDAVPDDAVQALISQRDSWLSLARAGSN